MNERRTRRSSFWKGTRRPRTGTHLVLLILLALGIRGWLLGHTTVAARDSIGFIRYAWQLQTQPQRWRETLRANAHPPLYPLAILAASVPVRQFGSGSEAQQMQFSAQLASAGAGVLLVFPLFFLGRELFGRRVGFWGAALFQCLPVAARVTSDALSEGVFLLWTTAALACAVRGLRVRSVSGFAGCGLFSALAYLTRPEGLLTAPAAGLVLLGWQLRPAWRWPWRKTLACAAALGLVMLMTAGPYMAVIGRITNKPTAREILGIGGPNDPGPEEGEHAGCAEFGRPLLASLQGITWAGHLGKNGSRLWWGLWAVASEVIKDFHYLVALPVLLGMWWFRGRLWRAPGGWVILCLCLFQGGIVWKVAVLRGYVSERHTLVLVLCGTFWAAAAVLKGTSWAADLLLGRQRDRAKALLQVTALSALTLFGLPDIFKPLHANRAGHRTAGLWLARHARPADRVFDPFCWAHFYAGKVFLEGTEPSLPPGGQPLDYVVLEKSSNEHERLTLLPLARAKAAKGTLVFHCPLQEKETGEEVVVYQVLRE